MQSYTLKKKEKRSKEKTNTNTRIHTHTHKMRKEWFVGAGSWLEAAGSGESSGSSSGTAIRSALYSCVNCSLEVDPEKVILTFTRVSSLCQPWEGASHRADCSRAAAHQEAPAALRGAQGELYTSILTIVKSQPFPVRPIALPPGPSKITSTPLHSWGSAPDQVWQALQIPILFP